MAHYDYRCPECGNEFEVEYKMGEHPEIFCPKCNALSNKVFSASGIKFDGNGFYNTDQRGSGSTTTHSASLGR